MKRKIAILLVVFLLFTCTACGSQQAGNDGNIENTESSQETEKENKVVIVDANDILTTIWETYEETDTDGNRYNDRFAIMGGHFESSVMDMPAKYDLTQASDLELMYCMPQAVIPMLDDAATMVHLMVASTFTAGAYHVSDAANVKTVVDAVNQQIQGNHWLDGFPDTYFIATVDEKYVISAVGSAEIMDHFEAKLKEIYGKQVVVQIKESVR